MATVDREPDRDSRIAGESAILRQMAELVDQISGESIETESAGSDIASCMRLLAEAWPSIGNSTHARGSDPTPSQLVFKPNLPDISFTGERFEIRRMLGHGGFGVVLLAFDKRLQREVALKIPRPEILITHNIRRRFLREAQAAAALDHPNIVAVFDTGEIGPIWFITSRYVPGPTLAEWLRENVDISSKQAANLIATLALAVHHAHSRGVLHRDLKPANVLLEPINDNSETSLRFAPRVSDFGLARRLDEDGQYSWQESLVGTPRYMAPEQAACRHEDVGTHTDVYSIGVILYEMLTGTVPLVAENDVETLRRIQHDPVPVASLQRRRVPRDLQAICLKCLHKTPAKRYETAEALAADLRRFLNNAPIVARPVSRAERIISWCRRRPTQAAFLLVLVGATLIFSMLAKKYWKQRTLTEHNFDLAQQAIEQDLVTRLKAEINVRAKSVADSPEDPEKRYALGLAQGRFAVAIESETARSIEQASYKHVLEGSGRRVSKYIDDADISEAFHTAIKTFATLSNDFPSTPKYHRELATAQLEYAGSLYRRREFDDARSVYEQASVNLRKLIADAPEESRYRRSLVKSETGLSDVLSLLEKRNEALEHCYRALEACSEQVAAFRNADDLRELGDSRAALSRTLLSMANVDLATSFYERHVNHWTKLSARSSHLKYELGRSHGYFGDLLFELGGTNGALQQAESELSVWATLRATFPTIEEYDRQNGWAQGRLNKVLIAIGDPKIARRSYERIFAGWANVGAGSSDAPHCDNELARSHNYCGDVLRRLGEAQSAREQFENSLAINTDLVRKFPKESRYHASLAWSVMDLGISARQAGDMAAAQRYYTQCVDIYYRLCADFSDQLAYRSDFENTANILAWMLATSDAEQYRDGHRALQLANDVCYSNGYKEPRFLDTLAAAHAEVGDFDSAVKWSTKALELLDGPEDDQWREPFSRALELYKAKKPMRVKAPASNAANPATLPARTSRVDPSQVAEN